MIGVDESFAATLLIVIALGILAQVAAVILICRDMRTRSITAWDIAALMLVILTGPIGAGAFLLARGAIRAAGRRSAASTSAGEPTVV